MYCIVHLYQPHQGCYLYLPQAFIPYSKLDPELVYGSDEGASIESADQVAQSMDGDDILSGNGIPRRQINLLDMEDRLVGKTVRCMIVQVQSP